jgi:hypothetical protein
MYVRSKDKSLGVLKCRLCNYRKESIDHLVIHCKIINKIKKQIRKMLVALGLPAKAFSLKPSKIKAWLTTSHYDTPTKKDIKLSEAAKALLRIMWRTVYAHFVQVVTVPKKFNVTTVVRHIFRRFMSRIMAYQHNRRKFFMQRRFSHLVHILPRAAAAKVADLGNLNVRNGRLTIHPRVSKILKKFKVWNNFYSQTLKNSYKKLSYNKF